MDNLGQIEVSSIFKNDFINTDENGKIVISENKLVWLTEEQINKPSNSKIISSLKTIAEVVRNINPEELKPEQLSNYIQNVKWINEKLYKHNETINHSFIKKSIDTFLSFITASHFKLSYQTLDDHFDKSLLNYYSGKSFVIENNLSDATKNGHLMTKDGRLLKKDQEDIFERLFLLGHQETTFAVQNNGLFRQFLIEKLMRRPDFSDPKSHSSLIVKTLRDMDKLKKYIPIDNLLKVMLFVNKNRDLMSAGSIGVTAKSRPHVRKFKANKELPVDMEYDTTKGDIIIKLGLLGIGSSKVVKKQLSLYLMQMQAIGKQAKGSVSEQELKMMQAAKGLPHVAQLYETQDYYSVKKERQRIAMVLPLYNMGELEDNLKKGKLSDLDKLQVAADMIKGLIGLHKRGIIHRDIKPKNIFLEKVVENGMECVHGIVADLGVSCFSFGDPTRNHKRGSMFYIPPEIWEGNPADFSTDAWSVGITLSEIFNGTTPMDSARKTDDILRIGKRLGNTFNNPPPKDKNSIQYVIWKLLQPDLSKRMTLEEALVVLEEHLSAAKQQQNVMIV